MADDGRRAGVPGHAALAQVAARRTPKAQILEFDRMIIAWHRSNETSKRLDDIPGVGPALATALVASIARGVQADRGEHRDHPLL
jgi:transposase